MGLFTDIKEGLATKFLGKLIADLGPLQTGDDSKTITFKIRQYPGKPPHLVFRQQWGGNGSCFLITRMRECADHFEKAALEIRKHLPPEAGDRARHE